MKKENRLEKYLKNCKSAEEKEIMNLLPDLERNFTILNTALKDYNFTFQIRDSAGLTAQVRAKKGQTYIVEGELRRLHPAKYRLKITQDRKGKLTMKVMEAVAVCQDIPFYSKHRSLQKFLQMCAKQYITEPQGVEKLLKQISSLPHACLQYLENLKNNRKLKTNSLIAAIKEESTKLLQSANITQYYYNNPETFKNIFEKLEDEQKKKVLNDIFESKTKNKELDKWLSKNYSKPIREVGWDRASSQ